MLNIDLLILFTQFTVDLDDKVCPVVLELASPDSIDDFRTEAVAVSLIFKTLSLYKLTQLCFYIFIVSNDIINRLINMKCSKIILFFGEDRKFCVKDMGSEMLCTFPPRYSVFPNSVSCIQQ